MMRMIDASMVHGLLDWPGLIEAMRMSHRRPKPDTARAVMEEPRESGLPNMLIASAAWQHEEALGVKLIASFPGNVANFGVPTVAAVYVLFDPRTGRPELIIDGEALIFRKTAADSALGASMLAAADASRLLMVGAGAVAPYLIEAMMTVRPSIRYVRTWNRTPDRASALARRLRENGTDAEAVTDLAAAHSWADIIIAATMADKPLVRGALVKPGTHINLVGSFTPDMREADDDLLRRSKIYVDDFGCIDRSGEFIGPLTTGVIDRQAILGDLFDLCGADMPPAISPEAVTLFKNGGAGQLDLFVAKHLGERLANADRRGSIRKA